MKNEKFKIQSALFILLFVNCSIWFFDGIIGWKRITFLVMLSGLLVLCTKRFSVSKSALIWLLYPAVIIISLVINNAINNWSIYMFLMYLVVILYSLLINYDLSIFKTGILFLSGLGLFHACFVIIHFLLKGQFTDFFFPLLKYNGAYDTAIFYSGRKYYFGLNYKPHEVAGIIVISMSVFLIWGMLQTNLKKKIIYIFPVLMIIPLLLTGKKGVTVCMGITFMLILLVRYISQKKWIKIGIMIGASAIIIALVIWYILTHLDSPLFSRFASFFINLMNGESADSGRGRIRDAAIQLWSENKLLGIGWFQFNKYTVERFGFSRTHSVNLDYLQFLCETGILGFILMMTPIIVTLKRTIQVWRNTLHTVTDLKKQWIIYFAVFVQFFTILYAFIEVPFYNTMYFTIYIFSCMIINNAYDRKESVTSEWI